MQEKENNNLNCEIISNDISFFDINFKVIIIGDSGVGKSCLSIKATKNIFSDKQTVTLGFEFFAVNMKIKEKIIKLQIWDTCGQEIYKSLISNFYRNSQMAILVYSIDKYFYLFTFIFLVKILLRIYRNG